LLNRLLADNDAILFEYKCNIFNPLSS
jgi:hypothetical protein